MTYATLEDAATHLAQLIDQANSGEEVIITHETAPIAKIVPVSKETSEPRKGGFGSAKHKLIYMADDFDAPLEDFKDYM